MFTIKTTLTYHIDTNTPCDSTHQAVEHAEANGMFIDQLPAEWEDTSNSTVYEVVADKWIQFTDEDGLEQDLEIENISYDLIEVHECWDDDNRNTNLKVLVQLTITICQ